MDDQEFQTRAGNALAALHKRLTRASDLASDEHAFEADFNAGALTVEFEDPPAKFVVSPNSPVRQIWVSAHSKSFKLDFDVARDTFVLGATGQTLTELLADAIGKQLGEEVKL